MNTTTQANVDADEIARFSELAARWWDPEGEMRALHLLNPLRLDYIDQRASLKGRRVLDVGCGGGLLAEAMALRGARVTAIDAAEAPLNVARLHRLESGVDVDYRLTTVEAVAAEDPEPYDLITCLEMLEHVPDPASVVAACARLLALDGRVFFSTINRNPRAYLVAVIGAEYLLRWLPRGTHDYANFIRPSELDAWARAAGLLLDDLRGVSYQPIAGAFRLSRDLGINYLATFAAGGDAPDDSAHAST